MTSLLIRGEVTDPDDANSQLEDELDWELLRAGDEAAFASLFARHNKAVYNHCFRRTGNWTQAEDATQAVFLALWRRAGQGRVDELVGTTARPILLAMANQECLSQSRSHARKDGLLGRLRLFGGRSENTETTDQTTEWLEAEHTMTMINSALTGLPEGQRQVLELVCWSELSLAEAAAALGIAEGTVKSRLHRARASLADSPLAALLEPQGRDPR